MNIQGADFFTGLDKFVIRPIIIKVKDKDEVMAFYRHEIYLLPTIDLTSAKLGVQATYSDALGALHTHYPKLLDQKDYLELVKDELMKKFGSDPQIALTVFNKSNSYRIYDPYRHPAPPLLMSFEQAVQKVMVRNEVTQEEAKHYVTDLCAHPELLPVENRELPEVSAASRSPGDLLEEGLVRMVPFTLEDYNTYNRQVPPHTFKLQDLLLQVWTKRVLYSYYKEWEPIFISSELHAKSAIAQYLAGYKSLFTIGPAISPCETHLPQPGQPDITEELGLI